MARRRGTFTLSSNIELEAGAPLDSRDIVQNKTDLTNGSFPYSYVGMETYVRSEGKKYRLIGDDPTVLSNWVEVGSGSGSEAELVEISEEDYAALTTEEKNDPTKVYFRYEANGFFKSVQDDPEATAFEGEKLATGRTIESVVDGKLEGKLDLTGGTMTGDLLTDTQTDIHAQRNLYLGNNGTSEESEGRSQLHFRRKGGGTNGITTLVPLQSKEIDDSYDENHYTQHLQCKSGTIALLEDVNKKADSTTVEGSTSVSGNPIAISDAANAYAEEVIANIEPIQDLHGYDHPWVGGAGKNLLPMTVDGIKSVNTRATWNGNSYTFNNVTFTILTDDGNNVIGIKVSGTASNPIYFTLHSAITWNGTYKISPLPVGASYTHFYGRLYYTDNTDVGFLSGEVSFTASNKSGYVQLVVPTNQTVDYTVQPMIRLATETDASFAPYSNICPISGLDSVEVKRTGKNLFDKSKVIDNYYIDDKNGNISYNTDFKCSDYIEVQPGEQYYIKTEQTSAMWGACYNENKVYVSAILGYANNVITIPGNAHYIRLTCWRNISGNLDTFGVNYPFTFTDYEPYTSQTNTISLSNTVYGGTLNVQTGELVVDRASVDLGSLTWQYVSSDGGWFFANAPTDAASSIGQVYGRSAVCSMYENFRGPYGEFMTKNSVILVSSSGVSSQNAIAVRDTRYTDATAFKTAVTGQTLVYELATPQTYQLTPSQVKLLLNHNNISTNADTLDLTYQVNNVLGEILSEAEGYTDIYVQKRLSVVERELYCQDGYYGIEWNIDNLMELVRAKRFMDFATGDFVVDNDVIWEITQKMPYSYYNLKDSNKANLSPHISLCPREIIGTQQYNTTNTNTGGYGGSLMPARMETEYEKLGTELKSYVATIRHLDNNKGTWAWTERQMFLPSIVELTGNKGFADGYSGFASSQHKLFAGGGMHRIKYSWYWTADPSGANTTSFCFLSSYGASNYSYASDAGGLAPLIVLK